MQAQKSFVLESAPRPGHYSKSEIKLWIVLAGGSRLEMSRSRRERQRFSRVVRSKKYTQDESSRVDPPAVTIGTVFVRATRVSPSVLHVVASVSV